MRTKTKHGSRQQRLFSKEWRALKNTIRENSKSHAVRATDAFTRLTEKAYSPLVIRKITKFGFPIYVGIITDDDLDTMDGVIVGFMEDNLPRWKSDSIQDKRNLAGELVDEITRTFGKTEGVAVTFYIDKTCISSLFGDFMNHGQCKFEYYTLLAMGAHV